MSKVETKDNGQGDCPVPRMLQQLRENLGFLKCLREVAAFMATETAGPGEDIARKYRAQVAIQVAETEALINEVEGEYKAEYN